MTNNQIYSSWHIRHELKCGKKKCPSHLSLEFFSRRSSTFTRVALPKVKGVWGWFHPHRNSIMSMSTCFIFSNPEINLSWPPLPCHQPTRAVFHSVRHPVCFFFLFCSTLSSAVWVRAWSSSSSSSADPTMFINHWHSDVDMTRTGVSGGGGPIWDVVRRAGPENIYWRPWSHNVTWRRHHSESHKGLFIRKHLLHGGRQRDCLQNKWLNQLPSRDPLKSRTPKDHYVCPAVWAQGGIIISWSCNVY